MKKLGMLLSAVLLAGLLMAGCSSSTDSLSKIKSAKKIVWGTNAAFVPFESNGGDKVVGVDADIAAKIAEKIGVELVVSDMEFDSLPAALASGKIDMIGAGFTKNDERAKTMDFSSEYFTARQVVIVRADDTAITDADALKGKTLGAQNGTTGDLYVASEIDGATVQRYDNIALAAEDLKNGKVDAVIADDVPAQIIVSQVGGLKIADVQPYDDEKYAFAVRKGDEALLKEINAVIDDMVASGEIQTLVQKYSVGE